MIDEEVGGQVNKSDDKNKKKKIYVLKKVRFKSIQQLFFHFYQEENSND